MSEGLLPPVIATLVADTKEFTAKMGEAKGEMESLGQKGAATSSILSTGFMAAGAAIGAVALGVAAESVHMAEGYQNSLTQIQEQTHMTTGQIKGISNAFLGTAGTAEYSAGAIASAYQPVALQLQALTGHTLSGKDAMTVMSGAMDLAATKNVSLSSATADTVALMKAYQVPLKGVGDLTNQMYKGSNLAGLSLDGYTGAMTKLHARLGVTMPSMSDMNTLIGDMSLHGIGTGRSLLQVTAAMQSLTMPTKANQQVIDQLLPSLYNSNGQFEGMKAVISQLAPAYARMSQQQQIATSNTIFGKSAAQSMTQIIDAGLPSWDKSAGAIQKAGSVSYAAAQQHKTLHGELQTLGATATTLGTQFGMMLLPDVQAAAGWMATTGVSDLKQFMKEFDSKSPKTFAGELGLAVQGIGQSLAGLATGKTNATATKKPSFWSQLGADTKHSLGTAGDLGVGVADLGMSIFNGLNALSPLNPKFGDFSPAISRWNASGNALGAAARSEFTMPGNQTAPIKIAPGPIDTNLPAVNSHLSAMQGLASTGNGYTNTSTGHLAAIKGSSGKIDGSTHDSAVHLANIASKIGQRDKVNITVKLA